MNKGMTFFRLGVYPNVDDFAINLGEIDRLSEFIAKTLKDFIRNHSDELARTIVEQTRSANGI